jgi:phosphopantetheine--protein transferase-like protein
MTIGRVVAYIDGGARGNPGPAGYGVRIETADGALVDEVYGGIGIATNNVAEYRGLLAALTYLAEHEYQDVTIRSDSQLLTKQMIGDYRVRNPGLKPLYLQASALVTRLGRVRFEHIPRAENTEADRLANLAMDKDMGVDKDSDKNGEQQSSSLESSDRPDQPEPVTVRRAELPAGSVLSIGVDFESISRVDGLLQRYGDRFLNRVFTEEEIAYSLRRKFPAQHLTGRFCAKEAAMKALGTGRSLGVLWRNVEVVRASGPPQLRLHGGAARRFEQIGAGQALVTITHSGGFAFAQVLLLRA